MTVLICMQNFDLMAQISDTAFEENAKWLRSRWPPPVTMLNGNGSSSENVVGSKSLTTA